MPSSTFGLPEREFKSHANHQGGLNGGAGDSGPRRARSNGLPVVQRRVLDPQGQAVTSAQPGFVFRPVPDLERHLWDVVAAIVIVFVRHRGYRGKGGPSLPSCSSRTKCTNSTPPRPTSIGMAGRLQSEQVADITSESVADFVGMRILEGRMKAV